MDSLITQALGSLAKNMSQWNKEVFGNLFRRKRKVWAILKGIQQRFAYGTNHHLINWRLS